MSTVYVLIAINEGKVAECIAIPHDEQNVGFGVRNALFDIYGAANVCLNSVEIGHIPDNIARFLAEKSISARRWNIRPIEDALNARIAELEAERRWIPVSERMPEKPGWYPAWYRHNGEWTLREDTYYFGNGQWQLRHDGDIGCWLYPLPEPPEEVEG